MNGEDFRMERLRHRLSQWQVARLSGVHPSRISRFETGIYKPQPAEHRALQSVLKKAVDLGSPYAQAKQG